MYLFILGRLYAAAGACDASAFPCFYGMPCKITEGLCNIDFLLLFSETTSVLRKGYFHLCPLMDFLQTLHINNSLYTNYENVFIELDSLE